MKTKCLFLLCVLFFTTFLCTAQLKVDLLGRVKVGPDRVDQDLNEVVSMLICGKNGEYRAGSKLSFGDFGRQVNNGWNVFVGEYGSTDTDQLWLHGKNGIYLTYYNGTAPIAYYDVNVGNRFNFNCDVYSNGLKLTSDGRLKEEIKPLKSSLSSLRQLNGVSYYLKTTFELMKPLPLTELSEKEKRDMSFFENWEKELQSKRELKLGFVAQELRQVFPELVSEDKNGLLSVDYIGLIPVLVESIKEQQQQIEALQALLTGTGALRSDNAVTEIAETGANIDKAVLYPNTPNPFAEQTEIRYSIPANVKQAFICIFDMQGKMLQKLDAVAGQGSVIINGSTLQAGIYLYSLVADGREVDTKRMILTK